MNAQRGLREEYADALLGYIAKADEFALDHAYKLGRQILGQGLGVLDQVMIHSEGLGHIIAAGSACNLRRDLSRAGEFLAESLSPFEMSLRGFRDANSRLMALQETLEQNIEQRTAELVKANKVKDDFLAMVSHELRTPLTSINAVIALLDGEALGALPDAMRQPVRIARRNCDRLVSIVNDLLDLTKISHGVFDLRLQSTELEPILRQVIEGRQINPDTHSITLSFTDRARGLRVAADPSRLQQVLDNLLNNAMKFSDAGSSILVAVDRRNDYVRVAVTDHGIGIAEQYYDEVFKPFSQADSSSTRTRGGAGLGLSIAKAIVEAHRGSIDFSSRQGVGTTFYFELPIEETR